MWLLAVAASISISIVSSFQSSIICSNAISINHQQHTSCAFIGSCSHQHRINRYVLSMTSSQQQQQEEVTSWNKLTVPQLKIILKEYNLPVSGVKAELIQRLGDHHNHNTRATEPSSSDTTDNNIDISVVEQKKKKKKYPPPKDTTEIQVVKKEVFETVQLLDSLKLGGGTSTQKQARDSSIKGKKDMSRQQTTERELLEDLKQSLKKSQHNKQSSSSSSSSSKSQTSTSPTSTKVEQLQSYIKQIQLRSANDIKAELSDLKLNPKGRKPDLVRRLAEYYLLRDGYGDGVATNEEIEIPPEMLSRGTSKSDSNKLSSFAGIPNLSSAASTALHQAFGGTSNPQPTPIQAIAISKIYKPPQENFILHAPTGSGKTISYLLPITETLWKEVTNQQQQGIVDPNDQSNGIAIVLLPTRELAAQVAGVASVLAPNGMVRLISRPMDIMSCWKDNEIDAGEEYEYMESQGSDGVGTDNDEEANEGKREKKYKPRILIGSAKSISISLFGDKKMPGTPTNKPQGKELLSNTRWLVMDEVDRLLSIKKTRTDKRSRHEKPAALLSAAIARLTLGKVQVIAASATVGRPLRRELSRVLGLHSSECPETLRGNDDTSKLNDRLNDNDTVHVGRAVKIPSTVRNYVLPVDGSTSGQLLTSAAFATKSLMQHESSFENVAAGRKVLVVLTRNCDIKVHNALGALRHFGIKPEPQSLLDALEADGTDRLVEAHRRVSGVEGVGGSSTTTRNGKDDDEGYVLVTHEDNVRGLHLDGLDAVIVIGRPGSPDEYTHIAGRTGRAGKRGSVLNIVSFEQAAALSSWTKMLGIDFLPLTENEVGSIID